MAAKKKIIAVEDAPLCLNCRFYVPEDSQDGMCHLGPPVILWDPQDGEARSLFALTKPMWWCGQWQRKLQS